MCYTHFYTISLLCKSYGYVIMHHYNETVTSNTCCRNIVFNNYVLRTPCPKQLSFMTYETKHANCFKLSLKSALCMFGYVYIIHVYIVKNYC